MRFQATIVAFAASLALTGAQDLSGVPQCALPCLVQAIPSSGCTATDVTCQCTTGQAALTKALMACIPGACSADDQAKLTPALAGICSAAGVTLSLAPSASAAASAVSSAMESMSMASASMSMSMASGSAMTSMVSGSRTMSSMASATGSAPPQVSTAAAPANFAGLGAVAMGLAAFAL